MASAGGSGAAVVVLSALLVYVAGLALGPMSESDLFFRIEAGRQILAQHRLPGVNLYSFTYPGHPDLDTSWLFEVGAAALHARGGFTAIVLAKTGVLVATFAGAFFVCLRRGAGPAASALSLAAAATVARERFVERPHVFSLAGVVLFLAVTSALAPEDHARVLAGGQTRRLLVAALAGVVLWANLHAGVFAAPALFGLAAVGARLDGRPDARPLAWLASGAALATIATPLGLGIVTYLRLHTILPALHPVDEFRAASWISDAPLLAYGALVLVALMGARPRRFCALLPVAAFACLALRSIRFGADFALLSAPVLAVGLARIGARLEDWRGGLLRGRAPAFVAALLLALATLPRLADARAGRGAVALGLDEDALPLDALRFVEENGLRERMYNDFEIGSYLLFEGYPRYRVFVDPRLPAYPPELHALLGRDDLTRGEWDEAMRRYGVDSALLAYAGLNRRVSWWDPETWALVYRAHDARVFVRRLPRFAPLIAAHEIPATFTFSAEEGAETQPLSAPPAASPVAGCEWQRRLGDLWFELSAPDSANARTSDSANARTSDSANARTSDSANARTSDSANARTSDSANARTSDSANARTSDSANARTSDSANASANARAAYERALAAPAGCLAPTDEARLAAWMGALALVEGHPAAAITRLERALALGDDALTTRVNRAVALERVHRLAEAAAAWDDVAARAVADPPLVEKARTRAAAARR